ncbi:scm-like with four MBT domains protein 2 isoform X2 [Mus pahari]|uniref:scm-like with four MBT domains protein 2 isoform X2 n=1 Tax=Mus pahari TaxID=10093 RepID=UPI000A30A420|nr:scm-like with four MBT domains protein 2 isoform X2 [Mus pahari]
MERYLPVSKKRNSSSSLEKITGPANGNGTLYSDEDSGPEDNDFSWGDYLEETGTRAVPHVSFRHVEISIRSSFQPGMKLEVANKNNPDTYWVATIITTCGQLLLLRYCGYGEDRRADFWCDVIIADLHPVGWCTQNNKVLRPPDAIKEKYTDWTDFLIRELTGSRTAPASLLEGPLRGKGPIDLITVDSLIELQDSQNPFQYWAVSVIENVGGRLRLRYVGLENTESYDRWLFYLDYRLRPIGWCQENKYRMDPPSELYDLKLPFEWKCALEKALILAAESPLPMEVFKDHADLQSHFFTVGMRLETLHISDPFHIYPASVTKVFNSKFFQVAIDDLRPEADKPTMLCHADSLGILPVQWCLKNGVNLAPPKGYSGQDFNWVDYHKQRQAEEAPHFCFKNAFSRGFSKNMKLEAVNPVNPGEVCVATVVSVKGRMLWLHLEGLESPMPDVIVDMDSMDIFPVGWCEANSYPLTTPYKASSKSKRKTVHFKTENQLLSPVPVEKIPHELCLLPQQMDSPVGAINAKYCCPQLFVNHRCFSGPFLNKGRISELPQSVGPGMCVLVLKEILTLITNAAYKPGRVLRELQLVEDPEWNSQEEILKAKYGGKTYRAVVKIVRTADQVMNFCRQVCAKLECCPNLLSPVLISETCPENCSVHTKTRYTYYYGKRRRVIQSSLRVSNIETPPKSTRRRKRRKSVYVQKRRKSAISVPAGVPTGVPVGVPAGIPEGIPESIPAGIPESIPAGIPESIPAAIPAAIPKGLAQKTERKEPETMDTARKKTGYHVPDYQTDTSAAQVPYARPRRAVTLRRNAEALKRPPVERARRARPVATTASSNNRVKGPLVRIVKSEDSSQADEERLILESNPLEWSVKDVVRFIKLTDCAPLARIFQEQDIDGQAFLLLTLPTVQECMELKLGPAIKLCHQIERVKVAFYAQYAS